MAVEVHAAATAAASVSDAHPDAVKFASVDLAADPFAVEYSSPPFVVEQRFVPAELLASDPAGWCGMLQALAPKLPVQLHCEPFLIGNVADEGCQPIFRRAVELLSGVSEVCCRSALPRAVRARACDARAAAAPVCSVNCVVCASRGWTWARAASCHAVLRRGNFFLVADVR
jgi:hypothetical protein